MSSTFLIKSKKNIKTFDKLRFFRGGINTFIDNSRNLQKHSHNKLSFWNDFYSNYYFKQINFMTNYINAYLSFLKFKKKRKLLLWENEKDLRYFERLKAKVEDKIDYKVNDIYNVKAKDIERRTVEIAKLVDLRIKKSKLLHLYYKDFNLQFRKPTFFLKFLSYPYHMKQNMKKGKDIILFQIFSNTRFLFFWYKTPVIFYKRKVKTFPLGFDNFLKNKIIKQFFKIRQNFPLHQTSNIFSFFFQDIISFFWLQKKKLQFFYNLKNVLFKIKNTLFYLNKVSYISHFLCRSDCSFFLIYFKNLNKTLHNKKVSFRFSVQNYILFSRKKILDFSLWRKALTSIFFFNNKNIFFNLKRVFHNVIFFKKNNFFYQWLLFFNNFFYLKILLKNLNTKFNIFIKDNTYYYAKIKTLLFANNKSKMAFFKRTFLIRKNYKNNLSWRKKKYLIRLSLWKQNGFFSRKYFRKWKKKKQFFTNYFFKKIKHLSSILNFILKNKNNLFATNLKDKINKIHLLLLVFLKKKNNRTKFFFSFKNLYTIFNSIKKIRFGKNLKKIKKELKKKSISKFNIKKLYLLKLKFKFKNLFFKNLFLKKLKKNIKLNTLHRHHVKKKLKKNKSLVFDFKKELLTIKDLKIKVLKNIKESKNWKKLHVLKRLLLLEQQKKQKMYKIQKRMSLFKKISFYRKKMENIKKIRFQNKKILKCQSLIKIKLKKLYLKKKENVNFSNFTNNIKLLKRKLRMLNKKKKEIKKKMLKQKKFKLKRKLKYKLKINRKLKVKKYNFFENRKKNMIINTKLFTLLNNKKKINLITKLKILASLKKKKKYLIFKISPKNQILFIIQKKKYRKNSSFLFKYSFNMWFKHRRYFNLNSKKTYNLFFKTSKINKNLILYKRKLFNINIKKRFMFFLKKKTHLKKKFWFIFLGKQIKPFILLRLRKLYLFSKKKWSKRRKKRVFFSKIKNKKRNLIKNKKANLKIRLNKIWNLILSQKKLLFKFKKKKQRVKIKNKFFRKKKKKKLQKKIQKKIKKLFLKFLKIKTKLLLRQERKKKRSNKFEWKKRWKIICLQKRYLLNKKLNNKSSLVKYRRLIKSLLLKKKILKKKIKFYNNKEIACLENNYPSLIGEKDNLFDKKKMKANIFFLDRNRMYNKWKLLFKLKIIRRKIKIIKKKSLNFIWSLKLNKKKSGRFKWKNKKKLKKKKFLKRKRRFKFFFFQKKKKKKFLFHKKIITSGNNILKLSSLKKILSVLCIKDVSLYFINALTFTRFNYNDKNIMGQRFFFSKRKKRITSGFSSGVLTRLDRKVIGKYKYTATYIKDFLRVAFICMFLKKLSFLANFIGFILVKLPKNRKETKLLKYTIAILKTFKGFNEEIFGLRVKFKGRVNRWRRTKSIPGSIGYIPFRRFDTCIEYGTAKAINRKGALGIRIWVAYHPTFFKKFKRIVKRYIDYSIFFRVNKANKYFYLFSLNDKS